MARPKKDAAEKSEAAVAPTASGTDEAKKTAGKRKEKTTDAAAALPKRTLRSNSTPALLVEPASGYAVKQAAKTKAKKTTSVPVSDGPNDVKNENGIAEQTEKAEKKTAEKGGKGNKKAAAGTANGKTDSEDVKQETTEINGHSKEKESSKPVKTAGPVRKKKAEEENGSVETKVESQQEEVVASENGNPKSAAGKGGKKKTEKGEEVVAPKKPKKETPKAAKSKKTEADEEPEEGAKPATAETKKAKGKAAAVKEVAIEHWNAERVKNLLLPFCSPSVAFSVNQKAPRRGSFEITLLKTNNEEEVIWSGVKRGPPRKEKFPTDEQVLELAEFISTSN